MKHRRGTLQAYQHGNHVIMNLLSPLQQSYERRLIRVTQYLHAHLDQPLDLQTLADLACMSPYHWHRIYQGIHGESVIATLKRLRMQKAAALLLHTSTAVKEIAVQVGYPNLQSFTRTFTQTYGTPPARFREAGVAPVLPDAAQMQTHYPVRLCDQPSQQLIQLAHQGSYMEIGRAFDVLNACAGQRGWIAPDTEWIGIYPDDPVITPEADLQSFAAISVHESQQTALPAGFTTRQLPAGTYAVLRYQGPYSAMQPVYQWFCGQWLPASGYEVAAYPPFEKYLNNPRQTAPADLLTDIYLLLNPVSEDAKSEGKSS
ncbi:AraC family transcriptional regulator [Undibacterium luofuense]|uniref:AraC family transcriptional regulator n=1 Tax=Undibacterium luofuense TaxID=2828733 RepID=UPI0030ED5BD9